MTLKLMWSALQLSDTQTRKLHMASNKEQHSKEPPSETNVLLKFVNMEQDKYEAKSPSNVWTKPFHLLSTFPFFLG